MKAAIITIGAIMIAMALIIGPIYGALVTIVVDVTPPVITYKYINDGGTYSAMGSVAGITSGVPTVQCHDDESGIASAVYVIEGVTYNGVWDTGYKHWYWNDIRITAQGTYLYKLTVTNNAGLQTIDSGTFTIYPPLQGLWYVDEVEVTSGKVFYYTTLPLTIIFKFQKTYGKVDADISAHVKVTGTVEETVAATYLGSSEWSVSYTFTKGGLYNIELVATDGTASVIMSSMGFQFPGEEWAWDTRWLACGSMFVIGAAVIGYGVLGGKRGWTHAF